MPRLRYRRSLHCRHWQGPEIDTLPRRMWNGIRENTDPTVAAAAVVLFPAIRGEKRELFALTEPDAGSDVMDMKANARRDGEDWILNGSKHFISGPCMPDFTIVFAATGEDDIPRGQRKRVTAFLVDVGAQGFDCRKGTKCVS